MAMKIGYIMVYDLEIFQSTRPVRGGTSRAGLQCRTIKRKKSGSSALFPQHTVFGISIHGK